MFTKTDYLLFSQCEKALWLKKHQGNALIQEKDFEENEVLRYAMERYPNGTLVVGETWEERAVHTKNLIDDGVSIFYKAVFQWGGKQVAADIARKEGNGWIVSKVTSSTSIKERLLDGLAYEWHDVLDKMPSVQVEILYLNKDYVRGKTMDFAQLFHSVTVNAEILERAAVIKTTIGSMEKVVREPECRKEIGTQCSKYGKESVECPAKAFCWSHVPDYSVFNVTRIGKKAWDLYNQGIVSIDDIPSDFKLSETQRFQVEGEKKKETIIDKEVIQNYLNSFTFPLYFLDFETYQQPVPLYEGVRPYQQIPFQYSLHILPSLMDNLEHREFLAEEGKDERYVLAQRLVKDIPRDVTVVAYNMSFEKMVIKELGEQFSDLKDHLMNIHDNIVDLMTPFQKKWYYMPEMKGSYSIKYVLPALLPNDDNLDYTLLNIQNGSMAMDTYAKLTTFNQADRQKARNDLLAYCYLDTYAMYRIWEELYYLQ